MSGSPKSCSVPGCEGPIKGTGLCAKHYMRMRNHGSIDIECVGQSRPGKRNGMYGVQRVGAANPFYGRKHSGTTKQKISKSKEGQCSNESHPMWLGDKVGYDSLHAWVRKKKGKPAHCSTCFRDDTVIHWANKDNTYSRNLDDYIALCAKCHWAYDKTYNGKRTGRNYKQLLALRSFT